MSKIKYCLLGFFLTLALNAVVLLQYYKNRKVCLHYKIDKMLRKSRLNKVYCPNLASIPFSTLNDLF